MTEIFATGIQMGESPRWHDGRFWMCDWMAGEVLVFDADGNREVVARVEGLPFSIDWLPDGRLVATTPAGWVAGPDLAPYGATGQPFNEIVVDAAGNGWVDMPGSMPWEEPKPGIVAVVLPDGTSGQVADDVWFPNGMAIVDDSHPGGRRVARRPAHGVDDRGRRELVDRRVWAELGPGAAPDGICVDAAGAIWYAYGPGAALHPGGRGRRGARDRVRRPRLLRLHARRRRRPHAVRRGQQLRPARAPPTGSCSPAGRRTARRATLSGRRHDICMLMSCLWPPFR